MLCDDLTKLDKDLLSSTSADSDDPNDLMEVAKHMSLKFKEIKTILAQEKDLSLNRAFSIALLVEVRLRIAGLAKTCGDQEHHNLSNQNK